MYYLLISAGNILFQLISLLILVNVIFSWIKPNRDNFFVKLIHSVTDPLLEPFRKISIFGALDFSPFIAILVIDFIIAPLYRYLIGMIFL